MGLSVNKWSVGWTFALDGQVEEPLKLKAILVLQILFVIGGVWIIRRRSNLRASLAWLSVILILMATALGGLYQTAVPLWTWSRAQKQQDLL